MQGCSRIGCGNGAFTVNMLALVHLVQTGALPVPSLPPGYWSVDANETTAMNGNWRQGPGLELFTAMKKALGAVPILAEDLGVITTDVVALR